MTSGRKGVVKGMSIKISADSTCDLSRELLEKYKVKIIPLHILLGEKEYEDGVKKYTYCPPFTKESLLYRDIFESYYPGLDSLIVDYWMPNKSWEGCNVNDPSARVLSNYGDSGK